jgi:hypothetical protein
LVSVTRASHRWRPSSPSRAVLFAETDVCYLLESIQVCRIADRLRGGEPASLARDARLLVGNVPASDCIGRRYRTVTLGRDTRGVDSRRARPRSCSVTHGQSEESATGLTTSWPKIRNARYSQTRGRPELFGARRRSNARADRSRMGGRPDNGSPGLGLRQRGRIPVT